MPESNIRTVCTVDHPCYLLVIVDDPFTIKVLKEKFPIDTRIQLITAHTIKHAISILNSVVVEAILLDLGLSDSDGIHTLKVMVEEVQGRIPIIVITGSHELEEEAFREKAKDFLTKPITNYDLVGRVKYAILRQRDYNNLLDHCDQLEREVAAIKRIEESQLIETENIRELRSVREKLASHVATIRSTH